MGYNPTGGNTISAGGITISASGNTGTLKRAFGERIGASKIGSLWSSLEGVGGFRRGGGRGGGRGGERRGCWAGNEGVR